MSDRSDPEVEFLNDRGLKELPPAKRATNYVLGCRNFDPGHCNIYGNLLMRKFWTEEGKVEKKVKKGGKNRKKRWEMEKGENVGVGMGERGKEREELGEVEVGEEGGLESHDVNFSIFEVQTVELFLGTFDAVQRLEHTFSFNIVKNQFKFQ